MPKVMITYDDVKKLHKHFLDNNAPIGYNKYFNNQNMETIDDNSKILEEVDSVSIIDADILSNTFKTSFNKLYFFIGLGDGPENLYEYFTTHSHSLAFIILEEGKIPRTYYSINSKALISKFIPIFCTRIKDNNNSIKTCWFVIPKIIFNNCKITSFHDNINECYRHILYYYFDGDFRTMGIPLALLQGKEIELLLDNEDIGFKFKVDALGQFDLEQQEYDDKKHGGDEVSQL